MSAVAALLASPAPAVPQGAAALQREKAAALADFDRWIALLQPFFDKFNEEDKDFFILLNGTRDSLREADTIASVKDYKKIGLAAYRRIRTSLIVRFSRNEQAARGEKQLALRKFKDELRLINGETVVTVESSPGTSTAVFGLSCFETAGSVEDQLAMVEALKKAGSPQASKLLRQVAGEYGPWVEDLDDRVLLAAAAALVSLKQASPELVNKLLRERFMNRQADGFVFPPDDEVVRQLYVALKLSALAKDKTIGRFIDHYEMLERPYLSASLPARGPRIEKATIGFIEYQFEAGTVKRDAAGNVVSGITVENMELRNKIVPWGSTLYFDPQTGEVDHYVLNGGFTVWLHPDGTSSSTSPSL